MEKPFMSENDMDGVPEDEPQHDAPRGPFFPDVSDARTPPQLLRIPAVSRTVTDLLGTAAQLDLPHAVLIGQRENGAFVMLTTDISTAEANYLLDRLKAILLGPSLELLS